MDLKKLNFRNLSFSHEQNIASGLYGQSELMDYMPKVDLFVHKIQGFAYTVVANDLTHLPNLNNYFLHAVEFADFKNYPVGLVEGITVPGVADVPYFIFPLSTRNSMIELNYVIKADQRFRLYYFSMSQVAATGSGFKIFFSINMLVAPVNLNQPDMYV